jgi:hypothetical protein
VLQHTARQVVADRLLDEGRKPGALRSAKDHCRHPASVARHFSVKEAQKAFRLFVAWPVRFLLVGGRGGLLDRNYALRAQDIGNKQIKTAEELTKAMIDIIPSDALFETAFSEARVSLVHLARYYLRALELKAKGDSEPEWVPMEEEKFINIEHILPQNPQAAWPDIDPETADAY